MLVEAKGGHDTASPSHIKEEKMLVEAKGGHDSHVMPEPAVMTACQRREEVMRSHAGARHGLLWSLTCSHDKQSSAP